MSTSKSDLTASIDLTLDPERDVVLIEDYFLAGGTSGSIYPQDMANLYKKLITQSKTVPLAFPIDFLWWGKKQKEAEQGQTQQNSDDTEMWKTGLGSRWTSLLCIPKTLIFYSATQDARHDLGNFWRNPTLQLLSDEEYFRRQAISNEKVTSYLGERE